MIFLAFAIYILGPRYATLAYPLFSRNTEDAVHISVSTIIQELDEKCACVAQRSLWDILWSCLATIFACSWVSVHPNMPQRGESPIMITLRRLELMLWTIIAPELIVAWAIRQWIGARELAKEYNEFGWTKTHGHFLQMGGFVLYEGENNLGVLSPERLRALYREGRIDIPRIEEGEIRDRSKADILNKTLVLGQTTWFVVQCVARSVQDLVITELELVTVAFAFLHGFMYFLWLNKPLGAQYPIAIHVLKEQKEPQVRDDDTSSKNCDATPQTFRERLYLISKALKVLILETTPETITYCMKTIYKWMIQLIPRSNPLTMLYDVFILGPPHAVKLFIGRLDAMVECDRIEDNKMSVPTFYAMEAKENENTPLAITCAIAIVFGAIHCAGWGFTFRTHTDALLWQVSSAVITAIPFAAVVVGVSFSMFLLSSRYLYIFKRFIGYILLAAGGFTVFTLPLYIVARFIILMEALAGMRFLLPGAFSVVKWSDFFPHI